MIKIYDDFVLKALKVIYYTISVMPLLYWIFLIVFLLVYYIACPCDCQSCLHSNVFLDKTAFFLIISVIFVFLSILVWFPLYLYLMYYVKKRFVYIYLICHALLVISIFADITFNIVGRIIL
jgi:hypothetical protein